MNKTPVLLAKLLWPALAASLLAPACSSGESAPTTGGSSSGGGTTVNLGSGGSTSTTQSSGGRSGGTSSSGGSFVSLGSGGASTSGSSGGSTVIVGSSGGSTVIVGGGSGGTGVVVGGMDNASAMNGYVNNTVWQGYAFTAASGTGTIAPACGAPGLPCFMTAGKQLCASGTVGADLTTNSIALIGFNVNQPATSAVAANLATAGMGLSITVSGFTPGLRAQLQTADMKTRWCFILTGATTMIPWGMFNTACYMPSAGTYYAAGTPIAQVSVVVPSAAASATPFNFCLVDAHQY